jgi:hypothetical protein
MRTSATSKGTPPPDSPATPPFCGARVDLELSARVVAAGGGVVVSVRNFGEAQATLRAGKLRVEVRQFV